MALASPDSEWSWTFRLLRGEILVLQRQFAEVEALIAAPLPPAASYSPLRARQKFVEAMLQRSRNQIAAALATLETARRLAPDAADVQFDIAWLDGQLRMRVGQWSEAERRLNAVAVRAAAAGDRFQEARRSTISAWAASSGRGGTRRCRGSNGCCRTGTSIRSPSMRRH